METLSPGGRRGNGICMEFDIISDTIPDPYTLTSLSTPYTLDRADFVLSLRRLYERLCPRIRNCRKTLVLRENELADVPEGVVQLYVNSRNSDDHKLSHYE